MTANIKVDTSGGSAAKPAKETVYIDVEDEITSIIDKVEGAKAKLVALVLPKRATTLQSVVNMRLLKRRADAGGKNVVLITSEAALLPLAGAAGIHVAKNLQSTPEIPPSPLEAAAIEGPAATVLEGDGEDEELDKQPKKIDYNRSIGELAAAHEMEEPEVIALDDDGDLPEPDAPKSTAPTRAKAIMPKAPKVPNFDRFRLLLFGGIAALIALIVFLFLAIFVLPKATVTIQTTSIPLSANLNLSASDKYASLNESANQIPASLKATNQTVTQTVNATGTQNQGDKASGTVTISNCTNNPVTISGGTGVSSNGLTFITQKTINLDSGNFTSGGSCKSSGSHVGSVNVVASQGGTKYNLPSGQSFTVSSQPSGVSGNNSSAFSGGTDNDVTIVSQSDVDNAKNKATSGSNSDDFSNKFIQQLQSSGLYVLSSTLKVGDPQVTANPAVGTQASSTTVTMQITYSVLTLKKSDLSKILTDTFNQQIDSSKQKLSSGNILDGVTVSVQNQTADAAAQINVNQETTAVPIIDPGSVQQLAMGKKKADIEGPIGAWPGVKSVQVNLSPFWVSKAPKKPSKIHVVLTQAKG